MYQYQAKNFNSLLGTSGFSDVLLKNHFSLYEGYVKNTNTLIEMLEMLMKKNKFGTPEYNELKRRFGWEYNGMRLHELYFGNMKSGGTNPDPDHDLFRAIDNQWGSGFGFGKNIIDGIEEWAKDFKATGALRGIGWAILAQDNESKRLFNIWINEHDAGHLVGATPLLVMDVFEHAFMLDYGVKRTEYIETFWRAINWDTVGSRFVE